MEVVRYANIKDEEVHAKNVEVVVYANIRDEEVHAKTVKVVVYANIRDKEVSAKTVRSNVAHFWAKFNDKLLYNNLDYYSPVQSSF